MRVPRLAAVPSAYRSGLAAAVWGCRWATRGRQALGPVVSLVALGPTSAGHRAPVSGSVPPCPVLGGSLEVLSQAIAGLGELKLELRDRLEVAGLGSPPWALLL